MPDQPDDPVHYDMKIPPEPQDAPLNKQRAEQHGSDEVTAESNQVERGGAARNDSGEPSGRPHNESGTDRARH